MRFIDEAQIEVAGGHGGSGAVSFRREKFVEFGGPDGGEGGRGGSVIIKADPNLSTLMDFRYKQKFLAENGRPGAGSQKTGRSGKDIVLRVPLGTTIRDVNSGMILRDMDSQETQDYAVCKGGQGGKGNMHFKSARQQAPRFAQDGLPGETASLKLELKLLADVAIIGLPNVGKSSFIACVSAAKPKIADYPFTTLTPNLGVVKVGVGESFVLADVPGLIEGAHKGSGLGIRFLKHLERSRILLHIVDALAGEACLKNYQTVRKELAAYDESLAKRPELVVLNKMDSMQDPSSLAEFCLHCKENKIQLLEMSVATNQGVNDVLANLYEYVKLRREFVKSSDGFDAYA